jgi:hypothetical protein
MMTVQEQVGPQVLILMVVGAPLQVLVKVQAPELVREEGVVGCASVYYSCSFSRRNIAACEQAPVKHYDGSVSFIQVVLTDQKQCGAK